MSRENRRIRSVIFDLDDTLIDWSNATASHEQYYRPRIDRIYEALIASGLELPSPSDFYDVIDEAIVDTWAKARETWLIHSFGDMLSQVFAGLNLDLERIDIDDVLRLFDWRPWPGVVVFPDAIPLLEELRRRGYRTGLLTNSYLPMWMRDEELRDYRLLPHLDVRVASGDIGYLKPHLAIYRHILEKLQTPPARAVFVGDRPRNDIAGANQAGLISVLMDPPHLDRELNGVRPDYTINRLRELLPILEEIERR